MEFHVCRICYRALPLSEFHKCKHRKSGHTNECKACKNRIDCARVLEKRKNLTDDEKVAKVFLQKKIHTHCEEFDILYKKVTAYIDSIPENKWEQFLNNLLYKYGDESTRSRVDCSSLLRSKQN